MKKWIIEVQSNDGWWKTFGYAEDEIAAREKASNVFLKATRIYMVRIRRNDL